MLSVCGGGGSSSNTDDVTEAVTIADISNWIINISDRSTNIFETSVSSEGVLEDVQLAEEQTIDSVNYMYIEATGIPNYNIVMTQDIIDNLNNRQRAASVDFGAAVTSASAGQTIVFGEDIGYNSSTENCNATGGAGYWPPGPGCPINFEKTEYFPSSPRLVVQSVRLVSARQD